LDYVSYHNPSLTSQSNPSCNRSFHANVNIIYLI
jgi:hypothetical protein